MVGFPKFGHILLSAITYSHAQTTQQLLIWYCNDNNKIITSRITCNNVVQWLLVYCSISDQFHGRYSFFRITNIQCIQYNNIILCYFFCIVYVLIRIIHANSPIIPEYHASAIKILEVIPVQFLQAY